MSEATETITIEGSELSLFLPASYGLSLERKFPLLLMLTPGLKAHGSIDALHSQGVLPEMIAAEVNSTSDTMDPIAITSALAEHLRLLDSPSARWIGGAGHDAVPTLRALLDHPEIFGAACCLSTSFEGLEEAPPLHSAMLRDLDERPVLPNDVRLYADYGTLGLDECYEPYHRDLGSILRNKGWKDGREFEIRKVPGGMHNPASWQERLMPALRWLTAR
jgi:hypothetical protein